MYSTPKFFRIARIATLIFAISAVSTSIATAAEPATHKHHHAGMESHLTLDAGRKWPTDEPLRKAMASIRRAFVASLNDIHENRLSTTGYAELAKQVHAEVSHIVSNCRLEPKADAQLHLIVGALLDGADLMERKTKRSQRREGAIKVIRALENYADYFDDAGWEPLRH